MQKMFFSYTRQIIAMAVIGMLAVNSLMADVLPIPTRKRPKPIPMKADPASQQPVRPYIQRQEPQEPEPMIATMYGTLIPLEINATHEATYALCRKVDQQLVPVCFIKWGGRNLRMYENKEVRATGFLKEKKGWTCPLLVVEYPENIEFLHPDDKLPQPEPVFAPLESNLANPFFTPVGEPEPLPPVESVKPLPPPQPQALPPQQPLPPPQPQALPPQQPLPPPQPQALPPQQPLPPPQPQALPPQQPLPPPQPQALPPQQPLPPPQPARLLPPVREESKIMSPSYNDYKPMPPKAVNPLRPYPY